eukprot:175415-Amphidinium_carterae.1
MASDHWNEVILTKPLVQAAFDDCATHFIDTCCKNPCVWMHSLPIRQRPDGVRLAHSISSLPNSTNERQWSQNESR